MNKSAVFSLAMILLYASTLQAKVIYVNKNASGSTHDGTSWATAFTTVQSGVNASVSGDEVWVAKSAPAAEAYVENVTMKENVALYGGFVGTETERSQRNWTTNVTVIESPSGGSSVVKASVSAVILDGFTISNGASGVLVTGSATVTNCTISRNYNAGVSVASEGAVTVKKSFVSGNGGYGIYVDPGTATVYNSTISNNVRHGIWIRSGTATVKDNIISDNLWHGFSVSSGTAIVMNCAIGGNHSSGVHADSGIATVTNCTVNSNSEDGIFVSASGTAIVTNCTISGNTYGTDVYDGTATISNSIVTFNGTGIRRTSTSYSLTLSYNDVYGNTTANYSNITDPTGTNGNISVDPLLSNPYRDIHIQPGSPCRDAGNDALVQPGWTDIDGQPRIQGAHVDIGSDESDGTTWTIPVATRFVKPTGDDGNDGLSWATAKKTITSALTVSQGLDEVWVSAGTYTENVSIPLGVALYGGFVGTETERNQRNWATNVTTIASPSTSSDVVTSNFHGAILDGFSIRDGDDGVYVYGTTTVSNCVVSGNSRYGVYVSYGTATVSNCTITENSLYGVYVGSGGTATVANCTVSENALYGIRVFSGGMAKVANCTISGNSIGVYVYNGGAATVTNCTIHMNSDDGVRAYLGGATVTLTNCTISGNRNGVFVHDTGAATVANCTISGNDNYGAYVNSGGSKLSNSLVTLNDKGVYSGHSQTLSHNDVYGNTTANYDGIADPTGTNGNISADPLFVDRAAGNLHLLPGSPCIDVGDDSVVTAGQTDLDGNPRIQGAHVDMGAYEYPAGTGYRWWNVVRALAIAGGAIQATAADIAFLNKDSSDGVITIRDAARIARKAAGLDANP